MASLANECENKFLFDHLDDKLFAGGHSEKVKIVHLMCKMYFL